MDKYGVYFRLAVSGILAALSFATAFVFAYKRIDMPAYLVTLIVGLVGGFVFEPILTKAGNAAKAKAKAVVAKKAASKATDPLVDGNVPKG